MEQLQNVHIWMVETCLYLSSQAAWRNRDVGKSLNSQMWQTGKKAINHIAKVYIIFMYLFFKCIHFMSGHWVPSCVQIQRQHSQIACCTACGAWRGQFSSSSFLASQLLVSAHGLFRHEPSCRGLYLEAERMNKQITVNDKVKSKLHFSYFTDLSALCG